MQLKKIIIVISILSVALLACIKQVDVKTRNVKPILVVEGNITTDSTPYTVRLTYSGLVKYAENIADQYLEKDAKVTISDDQGKTTTLTYTSQGNYITTDSTYTGKTGRSYFVTVILKDGTNYISTPEKMKTPIPVDSLNVQFVNYFDINVPTRLDVYINTRDPSQEENYYRWTFNGYIGRVTPGVGCGFGCTMFQYCYQKIINNDVNILSDAYINGNEIKNQKVGSCYIYSYFDPFVDIGQISLTKEAYQFWESYQAQQTRTGGILDPVPAAIKGNVYNANNPDEFALGYFSAAAITHRKVVIVPYGITPYLLQQSAQQFVPTVSIACFDYFPNTLAYPPPPAKQYPPPPGWEKADSLSVYW